MFASESILKDGWRVLLVALTIGTFLPAFAQDISTGFTTHLPVHSDFSPRLEEMVKHDARFTPKMHVPPLRHIPI
jgi:hypothetical protein